MVDALLGLLLIVCGLSLLLMPVLALYVGTGQPRKIFHIDITVFVASWAGYLAVGSVFDPLENHGLLAGILLMIALPVSAVLSGILWIIGRNARPSDEAD
ncbi:MAG: hypothetical protein ACFB01_16455 [Cohaesibacteraceae bacterium]